MISMKKTICLLLVLIISFFLTTTGVAAKVVAMEKGSYEVGKDEVIDDDLFVGAETVDIEGTVNGDVYIGAETVRVNGKINGDLHVGTGTFHLGGSVRDDVYVGAGNVTLSKAKIGDSLLIGSGNVCIDEDSSIGVSVIAGSGTFSLYAPVVRNVFVGAGTVEINSEVGGEARLGGGDISLGPKAKVGKDLYYTLGEAGKNIRMADDAVVSGKVQKIEQKFADKKDIENVKTGIGSAFKTVNIFMTLISFIGAFIVGYLGLKYFPKLFSESASLVSKSFFKSLGIGFLVTLVALPVLIILVLTGVGAALAGILLLVFLLYLYLSKLVVSVSLGNWIAEKFNWKMSVYGVFAVGLFGVYLLKEFPYFGFILGLVILWSGLGALILNLKYNISSKKQKTPQSN